MYICTCMYVHVFTYTHVILYTYMYIQYLTLLSLRTSMVATHYEGDSQPYFHVV